MRRMYKQGPQSIFYCPGCKLIHIISCDDTNMEEPTTRGWVEHIPGCIFKIIKGEISYSEKSFHKHYGKSLMLPWLPVKYQK